MSDENQQLVTIDKSAGVALVNPDELPDFDQMEEGTSLAAEYKEFEEPGHTERALFCGFSEMASQNQQEQDGKAKMTPLAIFQGKTGVWVNAGTNLVQQLRNVAPGTAVQVKYTGKEKTKGGFNVKTFEVRLLTAAAPGSAPKQSNPAPQTQAATPTGDSQPAPDTHPERMMLRAISRNPKLKWTDKELNEMSQTNYGKTFAELTVAQCAEMKEQLKSMI